MAESVWIFEGSHLQGTKSHGRFQAPEKVLKCGNHQLECTRVQANHEWVPEFSMVSALDYDIDVPCVVQWWTAVVLCAHQPKQRLAERWRRPRNIHKGIDMAAQASCTFPLTRTQTPIIIFLEAQRVMLMRCTDERVRRPKREMNGWFCRKMKNDGQDVELAKLVRRKQT